MSAGDLSTIDPLQHNEFNGRAGSPNAATFCFSSAAEVPSRAQDGACPQTYTSVSYAKSAGRNTAAMVPSGRVWGAAAEGTAKSGWLWSSGNLSMVAAGCGIALVLHTADELFFSGATPTVLQNFTPHILPPLCALLITALLAMLSQYSGREGSRFYKSAAERLLPMTITFAVAWTSIEWLLRIVDPGANARRALPLEALFTAVVVMFYGLAWGRAGQGFLWNSDARDVLIVGTDVVARDVKEYLQSLPRSRYRFRGFISTAEDKDWSFAGQDEVAGHVDDLVRAARSMFVDEVIVTAPHSMRKMEEMCAQARNHEVTLRFVPSVSEGLRRASEVRYIGDLPTIVAYERRHRPISIKLKRVADLVLGSVALLVLSPVFALIAIAIKLQSDGPALYRSERVGIRGRGFLCYKFRTMVRDADALRQSVAHLNEREGILFKISNDPRVTPLGAWLRRYSLDELPQLFNVLRGEMSLVGPRPSLRAEVLQYGTSHFRRLDVIPGMTGLWQVEARTDPSFESYVALDCQYANEWSMWLDMKILLRTLRVVILGTGV
jgi:exopolysaccharide biosynthesis polyprenyl glycosylphosphotransferase